VTRSRPHGPAVARAIPSFLWYIYAFKPPQIHHWGCLPHLEWPVSHPEVAGGGTRPPLATSGGGSLATSNQGVVAEPPLFLLFIYLFF
jgi:hypothetical protein